MEHSTTTSVSNNGDSAGAKRSIGPSQIGTTNFIFLLLTVIAQSATIVISWDAWQARGLQASIPNLPWYGSPPQLDYGYLLLGSLAIAILSPRKMGVAIHLLILLLAISTDQFRCQPQIIAIAVLMTACVYPRCKKMAVWFLVTMWFWAGVHKLVSPDWIGEVTYYLLLREQFDWGAVRVWDHHQAFAVFVAIAELSLGIMAWLRPKLAAPFCVFTHVGIGIFLILIGWNFSVLPWNFCTAITGTWLIWTITDRGDSVPLPDSRFGKGVVLCLMVVPIGFYFGVVRHSLGHVLYSANFPEAVITSAHGPKVCEAIAELHVPFPRHRKAFLDFFRLTGQPGWKLHMRQYRWGGSDQYFAMNQHKDIHSINRAQFFSADNGTLPGIALDDRRKLFQLDKAFHNANDDLAKDDPALAKILKRDANAMAWAIQFNPKTFDRRWLKLLDGLPNLEQVQLSRCDINDGDLRYVSGLIRLQGIGLEGTAITDQGLRHLRNLPRLNIILAGQTSITEEAIKATIGDHH